MRDSLWFPMVGRRGQGQGPMAESCLALSNPRILMGLVFCVMTEGYFFKPRNLARTDPQLEVVVGTLL
jgi:hypothetical protein